MTNRARLPGIPPLLPEGARFAFGESPFHAKGVLYRGTRAFFEANVQGGLAALLAEIREPELQQFISQGFLASGWYDVLPVPALIAYEARALRMALDEYLLHRTRYQARQDLGGVYSWVLRVASPGAVATRLPKIMAQMFDFVRVENVRSEPGMVEAEFHGIPAVLEQWLHNALSVYGDTALKLAGAHSVDVPYRSVAEPDVDGVRMVAVLFEMRWT